jgi:RimJ/RimL family protein N-acetyltransferase
MSPDNTSIITDRLELVPLSKELLQLSIDGDLADAEALLGCSIAPEWLEAHDVQALRLAQINESPELQPWLLRAVCDRRRAVMLGYIGFHTPPNPEYLRKWLPNAIEFGFTIFPGFRRQGYARESAIGLMDWASAQHQVHKFVLTVAPDNVASLALATKLGFKVIGDHMDDVDGLELVMGLERSA